MRNSTGFAIAAAAAVAAITFSPALPTRAAAIENRVAVNGRTMEVHSAPVLIGDTYMMPVRLLGDCVGCTVQWDARTRQATILPGDGQTGGGVTVSVGQSVATIQGRQRQLFRAPVLRDGQMLIALRDLAGFVRARIAYEPSLHLLSIHLPLRQQTAEPPVDAGYFTREWV